MLWLQRFRNRYRRLPREGPPSLHYGTLNPSGSFLLVFLFLYLVSLLTVRSFSNRDPTSFFFSPAQGYRRVYSRFRQEQAENYIERVSQGAYQSSAIKFNPERKDKSLCVGVATVARKDVRYFRAAIGSLLEGLDIHERDRIYLILFVAHTDPTIHPAFSESWLHKVADEVLLYNKSVSPEQIEHLRELENEKKTFYDKPLFDYTYLLQACHATGAPYSALLEDDVIAMDGWFHHTVDGISKMEKEIAQDKSLSPPLYLRLFYTEKYLGWNREHWPTYLNWSLFFTATLTIILALIMKFVPSSRALFTRRNALIFYGICLPLTIGLFFMSGKITALPLPHGVVKMDNFGCCSQGLVFPRAIVDDLVSYYQEKKAGFVDMLTEEYGNRFENSRWALTPSVIQHVGGKTSKDDGQAGKQVGLSEAETIFNFGFESLSAAHLREEHHSALSESRTFPT